MKRELARCRKIDVEDNEHGGLLIGGHFEYENGSMQGMGYSLDVEFLREFMNVFAVSRLQDINGESCWVTHDHERILKIEPLHKRDGTPFDVQAWRLRKEREHAKDAKR
jgi:hypothetical protein